MAQSDVRDIEQDGTEKTRRRFDARDWEYIADYVIDEYERRKRARSTQEKCWREIDRQIAMEPETEFKKLPDGRLDPKRVWMSEVELPLQAQALEVLTADARRMIFPDTGAWFRAHAEVTDEYLQKVDFKAMVMGDELEVPSQINQDNADKLVEGFLMHMFWQSAGDSEDFYSRYDKINAEAFKYGVGIGRARMFDRTLYVKTPAGVRKELRKIPVLMPCSVKNLYLDDRKPTMHSMQLLEAAPIACDYIRLENLQMAANRGSTDPDDDDGGWMPKNFRDIVGDDNGYVTLLEMEGDIVVPRKTTRSMVIPGAIVTVVKGGRAVSGHMTMGVIRFRFRQTPFSSYLLHPYHYEGADDIYPASPLMKGRPIQIMCTDALNRLLDSSALKNSPPVGWDRTDQSFAQKGGPEIYPYAMWGTTDPAAIKVHSEVGGDPAALAGVMARGISLYAELTGVLPARLGAQTTSHTTAFAKDAELQRGAVRTVDYVRQIGKGPMTRWLEMAYRMGRETLRKSEMVSFFIDAYGGYVSVNRDMLPERAVFEWFGSGGPAEEAQKRQMRVQSAGLALQIDQMAVATGRPPTLNLPGLIMEVLRQGGWVDLDPFIIQQGPMQPPIAPPGPPTAATNGIGAPQLLPQTLGYALGGRPPVGQMAVVGEQGPEIFVPDRPGTVIPLTQLASMRGGVGATLDDLITEYGGGSGSRGGGYVMRRPIKKSSDDPYQSLDATFKYGRVEGDRILPIDQVTGGTAKQAIEQSRVDALAKTMRSEKGYTSRLLVDDIGNVVEGQHRLEALRALGETKVPVTVLRDLSRGYNVEAMESAAKGLHPDQRKQIVQNSLEALHETGGNVQRALTEFEFPAAYRGLYEAVLNAAK